MQRFKLVVADRDERTTAFAATWLEPLGYTVVRAPSASAILESVRGHKHVMVLAASSLRDFDAERLCRQLRAEVDHSQVILLLDKGNPDSVGRAFEAGADDVMVQPYSPEELRARLRHAARMLSFETLRADRESEGNMLAELAAAADVHSRRYLDVQLDNEITRAHRFAHALALVLAEAPDIGADRRAERNFGRLLTRHLRRKVDWVASYAEQTLALVLPETTLGGALRTAERLKADLSAERLAAAGLPNSLVVSFGCSALDRTHTKDQPNSRLLMHSAESYLRDAMSRSAAHIAGGPILYWNFD